MKSLCPVQGLLSLIRHPGLRIPKQPIEGKKNPLPVLLRQVGQLFHPSKEAFIEDLQLADTDQIIQRNLQSGCQFGGRLYGGLHLIAFVLANLQALKACLEAKEQLILS
jgi:hypothetical protein